LQHNKKVTKFGKLKKMASAASKYPSKAEPFALPSSKTPPKAKGLDGLRTREDFEAHGHWLGEELQVELHASRFYLDMVQAIVGKVSKPSKSSFNMFCVNV
jgi:hypothetical protein